MKPKMRGQERLPEPSSTISDGYGKRYDKDTYQQKQQHRPNIAQHFITAAAQLPQMPPANDEYSTNHIPCRPTFKIL